MIKYLLSMIGGLLLDAVVNAAKEANWKDIKKAVLEQVAALIPGEKYDYICQKVAGLFLDLAIKYFEDGKTPFEARAADVVGACGEAECGIFGALLLSEPPKEPRAPKPKKEPKPPGPGSKAGNK